MRIQLTYTIVDDLFWLVVECCTIMDGKYVCMRSATKIAYCVRRLRKCIAHTGGYDEISFMDMVFM